jgi:uracil-DNA glycosylase
VGRAFEVRPTFLSMSIDSFIDNLAKTAVSSKVTNQYTLKTKNHTPNQIRRDNLHAYLKQMATVQPTFMLVGEAPGYRGARLTGIPFVSPDILKQLPSRLGIPPLVTPNEWPHIQKEASATIMWETLAHLTARTVTAVPLIWNAFPFHPHKPYKPQSNRKPTQKELEIGRPFLQELHNLFTIHTIIAVGNTAAHALTRWNIPHEKVRHPSHGGKADFQTGLFKLLI